MAGISDKALKGWYPENKYRFQKQEFQDKEFSDGSGLEMYEFKYRFDDPQIGRFWSIDPLADKYVYNSPYAFSENKVTSHIELEGLEATPINAFWQAVKNEIHTFTRQVDNNFAVGSKTTVETPITSKTVNSNTATATSTTTISTNFDEYMGYLMSNNSNAGNPAPLIKTETKNDFSVDMKFDVKTPLGNGSVKESVNQDGVGTTTTKATINTKSGVSPSMTASQSTDGKQKLGVSVSSTMGNSTGNIGATGTRNSSGTVSVEVSAGMEQKINESRISFSIYLRFGPSK
jgi:RHS repeat-associated protein